MAKQAQKRDEGKDGDALAQMRTRDQAARECSSELYDKARDDIKFVTVPGNQWEPELLARRKGRPNLEFPKLRGHVRNVINEQRQSRPQGKVRGTEEGDRGLAEVMQGICRNIESTSNAEQAYDIAFAKAVKGGFGAWRICTDYANDDDFEQDIRIRAIRNPFAVRFDPAAVEIDKRDGNFCFVDDVMAREDFERAYPDADMANFGDDPDSKNWLEAGKVRVSEYWYKEPKKRELWALNDGQVVFADELGIAEEDLAAQGLKIEQRRVVDTKVVKMRLTNGREFLTKPHEFPSKFIPVVPCWGEIEDIEGADYWQGLVRPAKDQQRLHNAHRSAVVEAVAKAPKAPFILKMSWIKGFERFWKNANAEDYPYLPVSDATPDAQMPARTEQAQVPAALIQLAAMDNDDMKATTGQYDASLGSRSNETSGRAINARKQQGATATYDYLDNLAFAIRYTYEILVDMIPRVYDTPRVVRVLGEDGGAKWKQLYQTVTDANGVEHVVNDIRKGKYDVAVTVGPSYATQRLETAEGLTQLAGQIGSAHPAIGPLLAYGVIKSMDVPGMDQIEKPLRKALIAQGLVEPGEGDEPTPPQQPNPAQVAQVRKLDADAALSEAKAAQVHGEMQQLPAELQKLVAETVRLQLENAGLVAAAAPPVLTMPNDPAIAPQFQL